ncbi:hypothetical protein [Dyella tabacisoli]|uniref:hypothetical protein n=1 Tax=Dyella tabacisoli TaxID=2282381 RepID=UPI001CDBB619|nr:hypothetical protein [Dyella tabacisoli]
MKHFKSPTRRGSPASTHLTRTGAAAAFGAALFAITAAHADQPVAPCHPNPQAAQDVDTVRDRGDIRHLPDRLQDALERQAGRPHTYLPLQVYAEAANPSQLFQYYLLNTHGFEANPFTATFPGINDTAMLTATGFDCNLSTIGAVRMVVEPKPGLPTDPTNVRAFIDVFTDISGLFVINNESGWYEGWMIHDLTVPDVAAPRTDGHAQFGTLTSADAQLLKYMGSGHNLPGKIFTMDGKDVHFPSEHDHFPDIQTNVVPIQLSMGAYNCLQQSDCHSYWEFNYTTNWIHPLYELPFTGGIPGTFEAGKLGALSSIIPGPGPSGTPNDAIHYGDNPNTMGVLQASGPRDPDKFDAGTDSQREFRQRFIPSGLANEIYLDTYERLASFEPGVTFPQRLFDAYAAEVKRVDTNGDGVISAAEGDVDTASDGFPNNERLFIPATQFNRFAVTREINDGLLAPRFAPSQRAWVLQGSRVPVHPAVEASAGRDADDR